MLINIYIRKYAIVKQSLMMIKSVPCLKCFEKTNKDNLAYQNNVETLLTNSLPFQ